MEIIKQNIINIYGKKGEEWLQDIPQILSQLTKLWNLSSISEVDNMTFNYIVKAMQHQDIPVIVKIGCDKQIIIDELKTLRHFNGHGSIQVIDYFPEHNALLLTQAIPGISLKAYKESKIDIYIEVMNKLHSIEIPQEHGYKHIKDWLIALDQVSGIPEKLLKKAISLKNNLLNNSRAEYILHGDLHHDNIIQNGKDWLAIDPKGIIGEAEFEIAAFDSTDLEELYALAEKAGLEAERVIDWVFVRLTLNAAWTIEDNGNPSMYIELLEKLWTSRL
jgi:streptomycin 6-kinase